MRSLIVLLGTLAFAVPTQAFAQSCGGSSGGGSGGSGGGGGGGASSSEPDPCADDSAIVGLSRCRTFGRVWDVTRRRAWSIGIHGVATQLRLSDQTATGSASHENIPHSYSAALGSAWVGGVAMRLRAFVWRGLSVGVEGEFAAGGLDSPPADQVDFDSAAMFGGALFVGGQVGLGNLKLGAELVAGRRRILVSGESHVGDCITSVSTSFARWSVRGRVALRYFMGPNASIELGGAYDVLHREASASVGFSLHTRSWDRR